MTPLFILIRAAAALAGAFVGWVLGGPVTRVLYRSIVRRPTPSWLVPFGKLTVSLGVAALVFFFLPLGGGDGWGWGPGWGMGPADGTGAGKSKGETNGSGEPVKPGTNETATRTQVEIELLGGANVMDGRYYLVRRKPPPRTLAEVEHELKDQADKLEVHLVFTDESIATSHPAAGRLRELLRQHKIPMVEIAGK